MPIEVKVPSLPESVADAVVVAWHKQAGEAVKRDESLVDIETDKVVLEVPAPADGVLREIVQAEGATVVANQLLANMEAGRAAVRDEVDDITDKPTGSGAESRGSNNEAVISPSARKLIAENRLDVSLIEGSGRDGRVLKEDVLAYMESAHENVAREDRAPAPPPSQADNEPLMEQGERIEKRVPMTRLRARIAERLVEAQHTAAILTTFNEVNMQPVMDLRRKYQERFEKEYGVRLGFMSFFVKAAIEALKRFPAVNASIDGDDIVYHGYFDIGVAVSSPRGLVVPVVRDADQMNLAEIEKAIGDYVEKAKNNSISIDDMTGGTFTLSNGGVFGSLLSTPILNPPQSGILGMHKIQPRAVVEDGDIVARPMMYLALSYDHRIVDGREAVQFLVTIKDCLEDPARMIIGV
jgi:2-oxoglutarate dehydrogenase E2 component (dihydrolipoamide succinyltransferase)